MEGVEILLVVFVFMEYFRRRKTMRLSRALSDLVKYTKSVRVHDIETQGRARFSLTCFVINSTTTNVVKSDSRASGMCRLSPVCVAAYMCSWQVSSLNESITNQILQLKPAQLVRFNQRQLLRVYPSNYRVDSSNFNPQPFWNAGCHLGNQWLFSFIHLFLMHFSF